MAERLLNKVAVVTGASGVLGRAIVQRFSAEGAKVVVFGRNRGRLDELAALAPARIVPIDGDATQSADLERLAQTTVRRFGGVDILVPAAGAFRAANIAESTPELVRELFEVNLLAALETVRACVRHLNPGASVVFLTASIRQAPLPREGAGAFCASKAALSALARSLAAELEPRGIRVNCVAPALSTEAVASGRASKTLARGSEVAEAVLFVASDAAAGIVGQEIVVGRS